MSGKLQDDQDQRITGHDGNPLRSAGEIPGEAPVLEEPFHDQHQQGEQSGLLRADIEEGHGEQTGIANPADIRPCLPDVLRPEDNPTDGDQEKRQQHLADLLQGRKQTPLRDRIPILPVLPHQNQRQEKQGMEGAPDDESPVGPVPQSAHQEDDERVPDNLRLRAAAAAQRDIHVIPEPSGQGDVPTPPELGDIPAEIRNVEVPHQLDTEQLGCADGNIRITGEISVDLEGKENGGQQQRAAALRLVGGKHLIHKDGAVIGHDHLLEQAPENLSHPIDTLVIRESARLPELRQQVRRPFDRAGHQLREEADESEELDDVAGRRQLSTVHVDGITERLESVETDADGKDYLDQQSVRPPAEKGVREGSDEEVVVLENSQNQQVNDGVDGIHRLRLPGILPELLDQQARSETARGSECDQEKEPPVPPSVEDVGYHYHEEILQLEVLTEDEPIEQKDYRQKDGEFYGVEKHLPDARCDSPPPAGRCCGSPG